MLSPIRRTLSVAIVAAAIAVAAVSGQSSPLPNQAGSLKFAAIGDNGTGEQPEYDIGRQMAAFHATFPFDLVIMLGDNMYGGQTPKDFVTKFERPYAALLAAGVKFQACLGNHDRPENVSYPPYNMNGQRYYSYAHNNVRFVALDSRQMDTKQLQWVESTLRDAGEDWKICYFHHPLYSDAATHGPSVDLRVLLEPLFIRYGVNVVFSGHDHVYERIKPQKGISYFVSGSAGQLRKGDMRPGKDTAAYFDQDRSFMLVEITGADLFFQVISRSGRTADSGVIHRPAKAAETSASMAAG
jgi:3',5'-cyclic AMP phosphodiesterase CpdA